MLGGSALTSLPRNFPGICLAYVMCLELQSLAIALPTAATRKLRYFVVFEMDLLSHCKYYPLKWINLE